MASEQSAKSDATKTQEMESKPGPFQPLRVHPKTGEEIPADYELIVEPNRMDYIDDKGSERSIHMPKGTFKTAVEYRKACNFEELAKFPV